MEEIIEIFGSKYKIVKDELADKDYCTICAMKTICEITKTWLVCETEDGVARHFELVK